MGTATFFEANQSGRVELMELTLTLQDERTLALHYWIAPICCSKFF